jgi:hypothetical protein
MSKTGENALNICKSTAEIEAKLTRNDTRFVEAG